MQYWHRFASAALGMLVTVQLACEGNFLPVRGYGGSVVGGGGGGSTQQVAKVIVSPSSSSIPVGATLQFTATPQDSSGAAVSGASVSWSSSNTAVATVSSAGSLMAKSSGSTSIVATSGGVSGDAAVTVYQAPVASVTIIPSSAFVTLGGTVPLTAKLADASGNTLTGQAVTWSSANTQLATVSATGVVTGVALGTVGVAATSGGITGRAVVTVQSGAAPVFFNNFDGEGLGAFHPTLTTNGYGAYPQEDYYIIISNDLAYSGSQSVKFAFGPDSTSSWGNDNHGMGFAFGSYLSEVWIEYRLYVPSNYYHRAIPGYGTNNKFLIMWRDRYGSGNGDFIIDMETQIPGTVNGNSRLLAHATNQQYSGPGGLVSNIQNWQVPTDQNMSDLTMISDSGPIKKGQWNLIREHVRTSSGPGVTDGVIEIWVDNGRGPTLMFQKNNAVFWYPPTLSDGVTPNPLYSDSTCTLHHGYVLGTANSGFTQATNEYVDDFKIYSTNPGW